MACKREAFGPDEDEEDVDDVDDVGGALGALKNEKDPSSTATWPSESIRISKAYLAERGT